MATGNTGTENACVSCIHVEMHTIKKKMFPHMILCIGDQERHLSLDNKLFIYAHIKQEISV